MRRTTPMRWIEEAEARHMWLHDAESKPAAAEAGGGPELLLTTKATLTVLVAKLTGRVARGPRERPSASERDTPADGCDIGAPSWIAVGGGAPYRTPRARPAVAVSLAYSRESSFSA